VLLEKKIKNHYSQKLKTIIALRRSNPKGRGGRRSLGLKGRRLMLNHVVSAVRLV